MAEFTLSITRADSVDRSSQVSAYPILNPVEIKAGVLGEAGSEFVPVWENIAWLTTGVNRAGFISGVVKYNDEVQPGIRVNLNYRRTGALIRTTFTDASGAFSFLCGLDATSAEYMVVAEGGVDQTSVLVDKVTPNNVHLVMNLLDGSGQATTGVDYTAYITAAGVTRSALLAVGTDPSVSTITALVTATESEKTIRAPVFNSLLTGLGRLGSTAIHGVLKKSGIPAPREIRVYDRTTGELVTSTFSNTNGEFVLTGVSPGDYYVTAHDFGTINNTAVIRNITI